MFFYQLFSKPFSVARFHILHKVFHINNLEQHLPISNKTY